MRNFKVIAWYDANALILKFKDSGEPYEYVIAHGFNGDSWGYGDYYVLDHYDKALEDFKALMH